MRMIFVLIISINLLVSGEILGRIYFEKGDTNLTKESEEVIKNVAQKLISDPNIIIDIIGYTDNLGSEKINIALSQKRASSIKKYLVKNFGIHPDRIYTYGLGSQNPIAPNDTEEGRRKNRRVEISIHSPDAILSYFKNEVLIQPVFLKPEWIKAFPEAFLYKLYKVNTKKNSCAEILFPEKGRLNLDEDALLIIYGFLKEERKKNPFHRVELQSGALRPLLTKLSKDENFVVNTPAALVELRSKNSKILVDKSLRSLIAVYEGNADVSAMGQKVRVNEGEGTKVEMGKPPEPPRPLPQIPELLGPQDNERLYNLRVLFRWKKTSTLAHFQLAKDTMFRDLVLDTILSLDSIRLKLGKGEYYWRLSGIDEDNFEGKFSKVVKFSVIQDTVKPKLYYKIEQDNYGNIFLIGKTKPSSLVIINGNKITAKEDSFFVFSISPETRLINVKIIDQAGNESKEYRFINPYIKQFKIINFGMGFFFLPLLKANSIYAKIGFEKRYSYFRGFYFDIGLGSIEKKKYIVDNADYDSIFVTKVITGSCGLRLDFGSSNFVPFFKIGIGGTWWKNILNENTIAQAGERWTKFFDPSAEFELGFNLKISKNSFLILYTKSICFSNFSDKYFFMRNRQHLYSILGIALEIRM